MRARGIGIDTVHLPDFRNQVDEPGSAFVEGTFTTREIAASSGRADNDRARHLAVRFAAKEALLKAWACMFWGEPMRVPPPVDMREIEVESDVWGRPRLRLSGAIGQAVEASGPLQVMVSMSHDGPSAVAVVILESIDG